MAQQVVSGLVSGDEYEFDPTEDAVCVETSTWTKRAGIIQVVLGLLMVIGSFFQFGYGLWRGVESIATAVGAMVIGSTLLNAAAFLKRVATTEGNDVFNLMTAVDGYKRAFKVQVLVFAVSLLVFVVSLVVTVGAFVVAVKS